MEAGKSFHCDFLVLDIFVTTEQWPAYVGHIYDQKERDVQIPNG